MEKAITIKDIAAQLNMSRNTVAKALNGKYVPEKTREAVLAKARELNYKSMGANAVETKRRNVLLLSGKPLGNMKFFTPIIRGIENHCYQNNYCLSQYIYNRSTMAFSDIAEYVNSLHLDGIIAIESFNKEFVVKLLNLGLPVCFIDFTATSNPIVGNYDIVETGNTRPVYELTRRLHREYGTSKFCFVGDYTHCLSFEERYFGMIQALAVDGLEHCAKDDILRSDNFNYGSPDAIVSEISALRNMPDCFICCNDFVARSVCNALKKLNVKVPEACFVVGYDNVPEACSGTPEITSFGCNKEFLGAEAVRTLVSRIGSPSTPTKTITVRAKPVYRASTER